MAFSSRSGSTFISREIVRRYDCSPMEESLNPIRVQRVGLPETRGWFAFKAGVPGLIVAEESGFFSAYLQQTYFLILYRRDVIAQAISLWKAKQSQEWHSNYAKTSNEPVYNAVKITQSVRNIVEAMEVMEDVLAQTRRPTRRIFYEDSVSDFSTVERSLDDFGVPKRAAWASVREVSPVRDRINAEWAARFRGEAGTAVTKLMERYQALLARG